MVKFKLTFIVTIISLLSATAQHGAVFTEYNHFFNNTTSQNFVGKKTLNPIWNNYVQLGYSYHFKNNSPFHLRATLGYYISGSDNNAAQFALENKFDYNFYEYTKKPVGYSATGGLKYVFRINPKFRLCFILDTGVLVGNGSKLNLYKFIDTQSTLVTSVGVPSTQFLIDPKVSCNFHLYKSVTLYANVGYNNLGGVNAGGGLNVQLDRRIDDWKLQP
jgi:hypothetical protein